MILCDGKGRKVGRGRTVRFTLLQAAYHTAQNMTISTADGEPLIRCIINGVMPQSLQKVLRGEIP